MGNPELDKLINQYIEAIIIHGEESVRGNVKTANKNYQIAKKCYNDIKSYGGDGLSEIIKLMNHKNLIVQVDAASRSLFIDAKLAVKKLKKLKKKKGMIGFNAEIILNEWEEGNLTENS